MVKRKRLNITLHKLRYSTKSTIANFGGVSKMAVNLYSGYNRQFIFTNFRGSFMWVALYPVCIFDEYVVKIVNGTAI